MAWTIRFDDSGAAPFIEITSVGTLDVEQLAAAFTAAHDMAEETGAGAILSDSLAMMQGPTPDELRAVVGRIADIGFTSRYRQAILLPRDAAAAAATRQWEEQATEAGLSVRTFTDRAAAIEWLTHGGRRSPNTR